MVARESIIGISLLISFLFILIRIIYLIFQKGINHFNLLKKIYPAELNKVNSYFSLMWLTNSFVLNLGTMLWFWFPIYIKKPYQDLSIDLRKDPDVYSYHQRLILINKQMLLWIFLLICHNVISVFLLNHYGSNYPIGSDM